MFYFSKKLSKIYDLYKNKLQFSDRFASFEDALSTLNIISMNTLNKMGHVVIKNKLSALMQFMNLKGLMCLNQIIALLSVA